VAATTILSVDVVETGFGFLSFYSAVADADVETAMESAFSTTTVADAVVATTTDAAGFGFSSFSLSAVDAAITAVAANLCL
jgi:hypothetical protein